MQGFTLEELATYTKARLVGDPNHRITGVADLASAGLTEASFFSNPRYEKAMRDSKAGVVFVSPEVVLEEKRNFLVVENPSQAFQTAVEAFYEHVDDATGFQEIHPTAVIHETCTLGNNVVVGPNAVLDREVTIGDHTFIGAGCYIGPMSCVGQECILHPNVTIRERCRIGNRVIIQPGVVIGACGYGYVTNAKGHHEKLKQLGTVSIEDDVEIGANTTIDRARFTTTRIGRGTKVDNLVQIAHGVSIGEDNFIIAQTGIAGSSKTGRHVVLAGQTAVDGHLELGDGVIISARSGVSKSLPKAGAYGGAPAYPIRDYNRNSVFLRNIERYINEFRERLERLESDNG